MNKKICRICDDKKDVDDFPFRNKEKNIRHTICKKCWKEIRKISYNKNKKVTLDRNKRNKKKSRDWYNKFKSNLKCNRCPENHPSCLEFHHIDPNEKEFAISILIGTTYSINKIKKEIKKCEILCANCHRKHHYNEKHKNG